MSVKEITIIAPEGMVAGGNTKGESFEYFNLVTGDKLGLSDSEAKNDKSWHIAFKRSFICINSGPAGPGGVVGACIDPPVDVSREEFVTLTDYNWKQKFDAVKSISDDAKLAPEGIEPAIFGWRIERDGEWKAPVGKGWKVRCADGVGFAKMRVKEVDKNGETISIQFAYQREKDSKLGEDKIAVIRPGESFSFKTGGVIEPSDIGWDIKHGGDKLYVNSSVSGPGSAGVIGSNKYGAKWKTIDNPSDSIAYFMDEYGAVFRTPKWYRYNIDGKHNIHPNGAVYGLQTAEGDFKAQVYDYFEHKGSDLGNIRVRYEKL